MAKLQSELGEEHFENIPSNAIELRKLLGTIYAITASVENTNSFVVHLPNEVCFEIVVSSPTVKRCNIETWYQPNPRVFTKSLDRFTIHSTMRLLQKISKQDYEKLDPYFIQQWLPTA